jgi:hypothetical protein
MHHGCASLQIFLILASMSFKRVSNEKVIFLICTPVDLSSVVLNFHNVTLLFNNSVLSREKIETKYYAKVGHLPNNCTDMWHFAVVRCRFFALQSYRMCASQTEKGMDDGLFKQQPGIQYKA